MPLSYYLIDGYNLLHAADLARSTYGPGDLERARTGLLVRLADGFDDSERERTTVVFDASDPPPDAEPSFRFREMTVLFAVDEREADALIEELIRRHPSPRQLRVVSDDMRLQRAAKRRGAQAVRSEALLKRLNRMEGSIRPRSWDEGGSVGEVAQVTEWLEFFGVDKGRIEVDGHFAPAPEAGKRRPGPSGGAAGASSKSNEQGSGPGDAGRRQTSATGPSLPPEEQPSGEDFRFWQRRIDDLLRRE